MGINASAPIKNEGIHEISDGLIFHTEKDFGGKAYEIKEGKYTYTMFIDKVWPDNMASIIVPPYTNIQLYGGEMYDYGNVGSYQIANNTDEKLYINELPKNIFNNVRSISVNKIKSEIVELFDDPIDTLRYDPCDHHNSCNHHIVIYYSLLIVLFCIYIYH